MNLETGAGLAASIMTTMAMIPQLIKIFQDKKAENISLLWLVILFAGLCAWIYYGFLKNDLIIIISNILSATINALIGILSVHYKKKQNNFH